MLSGSGFGGAAGGEDGRGPETGRPPSLRRLVGGGANNLWAVIIHSTAASTE